MARRLSRDAERRLGRAAHLNHLALTSRVQPHDVGESMWCGGHNLIDILLDDKRLREAVNLLP